MNHRFLRSVFVVSALFLAAGCDKKSGPVVAQVGSTPITLEEVQKRLRDTPPAYQHYVGTAEGRKQYLQLIVREKTVLTKARQDGMDNDPSYKKAVAGFKERQTQQLEDYKNTLMVESYLQKLRGKDLAVTDAEVQAYYDAHRAPYDHPQEISAAHILVNTLEEAQQVLSRLKAGEPFEKIARDVSRDPASAAQGGRLAPFRHGTLVPEFEQAAFALKKGQVSAVVQTQFGFHIIKKIGQADLPPRPYADFKEDIRRQLERSKFDQWVMKQETELGVKIDEPTAALLSLPPAGQAGNPAGEPAQETPKQ